MSIVGTKGAQLYALVYAELYFILTIAVLVYYIAASLLCIPSCSVCVCKSLVCGQFILLGAVCTAWLQGNHTRNHGSVV